MASFKGPLQRAPLRDAFIWEKPLRKICLKLVLLLWSGVGERKRSLPVPAGEASIEGLGLFFTLLWCAARSGYRREC